MEDLIDTIDLIDIKKQWLAILKEKYWEDNILIFDDIEIKDNMTIRNSKIPNLLLSNYISVKMDKYTKWTIILGRWDSKEELINNYLEELKKFN